MFPSTSIVLSIFIEFFTTAFSLHTYMFMLLKTGFPSIIAIYDITLSLVVAPLGSFKITICLRFGLMLNVSFL